MPQGLKFMVRLCAIVKLSISLATHVRDATKGHRGYFWQQPWRGL